MQCNAQPVAAMLDHHSQPHMCVIQMRMLADAACAYHGAAAGRASVVHLAGPTCLLYPVTIASTTQANAALPHPHPQLHMCVAQLCMLAGAGGAYHGTAAALHVA